MYFLLISGQVSLNSRINFLLFESFINTVFIENTSRKTTTDQSITFGQPWQ